MYLSANRFPVMRLLKRRQPSQWKITEGPWWKILTGVIITGVVITTTIVQSRADGLQQLDSKRPHTSISTTPYADSLAFTQPTNVIYTDSLTPDPPHVVGYELVNYELSNSLLPKEDTEERRGNDMSSTLTHDEGCLLCHSLFSFSFRSFNMN